MAYYKKLPKYRNKKSQYKNKTFDSINEKNRYVFLDMLQNAGEISELQCQVSYVLMPNLCDDKGKVIERKVKYVADFVYKNRDGEVIVEDVKGMKTKDYILKRKMMLYFKGIRIKEVDRFNDDVK